MLYMMWYDDDPKKGAADKIREAVAAYTARFTTTPSLVLVNEVDYASVAEVVVRSERTVQPNNFWVGYGVATEQ